LISKPFIEIGWARGPGAGAAADGVATGIGDGVAVVAAAGGEADRRRQAGVDRGAGDIQRGDAGGTGVGRAQGAGDRRGRGDAAGIIERARHAAGGRGHRLDEEAVACLQGGLHVDGEAVHRVAAGDAARQAVRLSRQQVLAGIGRVGLQRVVAGLQQAGVADAHADLGNELPGRIALVVLVRLDLRRADAEQGRPGAGRVAQVQAHGLLLVDLGGEGRGQLAEAVARVDQVLVLELQQAGHRAAGEHVVVQRQGLAIRLQRQGRTRRIRAVGLDHQAGGLRAQHQALAAGDEDAQRAVAGRDGGDLDVLAELLHDLVALVEQVIGLLVQAAGRGDLLVERGDLLRQLVDAGRRIAEIRGDAGLQHIQLGRSAGETRRHVRGARQHDLAGRVVAGRIGEIGLGAEEVAQCIADAVAAGGEDIFELLQLDRAGIVHGRQRLRGVRLGGEEIVVRTDHIGDAGALAEEAGTGELPRVGGQHRALARVARDVGVGDVVAGDLQRGLVGHHRAQADGHEAGGGHGAFSCGLALRRCSGCAGRAAWCR
jgi:hypothetical protein